MINLNISSMKSKDWGSKFYNFILGFLLIVAGIALTSSCAVNLAGPTSGEIGCPPQEIVISNEQTFGSMTRTWTATCRGQEYFCSATRTGGENVKLTCKKNN